MTPVAAFDYNNHPAARPAEGQSIFLPNLPQELLLQTMSCLPLSAKNQLKQVSQLFNRIGNDSSFLKQNLINLGFKTLTGTPDAEWAALGAIWNRKVEGDERYAEQEMYWAKFLGPLFYTSLPEYTYTDDEPAAEVKMKKLKDTSDHRLVRAHNIDKTDGKRPIHRSSIMMEALLRWDEDNTTTDPVVLELKLYTGPDGGKISGLETNFYQADSMTICNGILQENDFFYSLFKNITQKNIFCLSSDDGLVLEDQTESSTMEGEVQEVDAD